ncbi:hypothetical protein GGR57DRAFT_506485 [Xylariaceae sp. FL1272]|nr:hypothetical protein GGR57DRAFT_506485 [Xylariaceae sp. FL1272]
MGSLDATIHNSPPTHPSSMTNEHFLARLTLRRLEQEDSFPERHLTRPGDANHNNDHAFTSRRERPPKTRSESPEGYDFRGRYWEAADLLKLDLQESRRPPNVWDFIYDDVCLPPTGMAKTLSIRRLGRMPIRRAWRRKSYKEKPDLQQINIVEAIMVYERGQIVDADMQCDWCRDGKGATRECVIMPCIGETICSNCLYDGNATGCNICHNATRPPDRLKTDDSEAKANDRGKSTAQINPTVEDYVSGPTILMIVLKLIEQMKRASAIGLKNDINIAAKAKRIERAALEVARAAREWGLVEGSMLGLQGSETP